MTTENAIEIEDLRKVYRGRGREPGMELAGGATLRLLQRGHDVRHGRPPQRPALE